MGMAGVRTAARGAALTLLFAAAGCGSGSGLPSAGAPSMGLSDAPMDLVNNKVSTAALLVWGVQLAAPPRAIEQTTLGVSALPKPGPDPPLAKALPGSSCPVVEFVKSDPALAPLPDPLSLVLTFLTAGGGQCVSGNDTDAGQAELTVRGADAVIGGALVARTGADLVVRETYPTWTRTVTGGPDRVIYSFGGTRTVRVKPDGTTLATTDPFVTRWVVTRDPSTGVKTGERFYLVSNLSITRAKADGLGGPDTAYTEDGTLHLGTSEVGYADVTLQAVKHDPAVCGGTPTGGLMTFVAAGQKTEVFFTLTTYQTNPSVSCGRAYVRRPDTPLGTVPPIEVFGTTPPVL
jgi:hypothetical protein